MSQKKTVNNWCYESELNFKAILRDDSSTQLQNQKLYEKSTKKMVHLTEVLNFVKYILTHIISNKYHLINFSVRCFSLLVFAL